MSAKHAVTVKGRAWSCACGASGAERASLLIHARAIRQAAKTAAWKARA